MSGLKALLAKQAQAKTETQPDVKDQAVVQETSPAETIESDVPVAQVNTSPALLKRFGSTASPVSGRSDESPRQAPAPVPSSLDELADFESGIGDIGAGNTTPSGFADETPATAPLRDLSEMGELDREAIAFVATIDSVYEIYHDAELMGNYIRSIMIELKSSPQYVNAKDWSKSLVQPDDIRLWIRGMRDSMGLAKMKKAESKAKRAGGGAKKTSKVDDDMLADLASLGIDMS